MIILLIVSGSVLAVRDALLERYPALLDQFLEQSVQHGKAEVRRLQDNSRKSNNYSISQHALLFSPLLFPPVSLLPRVWHLSS